MNNYLSNIYLANTVFVLLLFTGLFFVPYGKINIPTSTTYEYIKTGDHIVTLFLNTGLIILNFINLLAFKNPKPKSNLWVIWITLVLFILCLLQIHLEENGHAGNLMISPDFSSYNFQPGFLVLIGIISLLTINLFIAKQQQFNKK